MWLSAEEKKQGRKTLLDREKPSEEGEGEQIRLCVCVCTAFQWRFSILFWCRIRDIPWWRVFWNIKGDHVRCLRSFQWSRRECNREGGGGEERGETCFSQISALHSQIPSSLLCKYVMYLARVRTGFGCLTIWWELKSLICILVKDKVSSLQQSLSSKNKAEYVFFRTKLDQDPKYLCLTTSVRWF